MDALGAIPQSTFGLLSSGAIALYAPALVLLLYFFAIWDARRPESAAAADTQIGLKVALHAFALVGAWIAASGASSVVASVLGLIGGHSSRADVRLGIGHLVAGGAVVAAVTVLLLPRTNWRQHDRVTRLTVGAMAAIAGIAAIVGLTGFLSGLLTRSWGNSYPLLALTVVFGGLAYASVTRFGAMCGWVAPPPGAVRHVGHDALAYQQGYPPPQAYPPHPGFAYQPGYPPHQGFPGQSGYPPLPDYAPQQSYQPPASAYAPPWHAGSPAAVAYAGASSVPGGSPSPAPSTERPSGPGLPTPSGSYPPGSGNDTR